MAARLGALAAIALLGVAPACTTASDPVPVATMTLFPTSDSVEVGQANQVFAVTLQDANGKILTGRRVVWSSSNPGIATVGSDGNVLGVAVGQAVITATADGKTANAVVRVIIPLARIVLLPDSFDLPLTLNRTIGVQMLGPQGEAIIGRTIIWSSANPAVATVSAAGDVTSISLGKTTITAATGSKSAKATVVVTAEPVSRVDIYPTAPVQVVRLGQTVQLTAICYNVAGKPLPYTIIWSSGNPSVATVNSSGLVVGVALGAAPIVAACVDKSSQVQFQVTPVPVTSVTVTPSALTLFTGQVQQLTATARDSANNVLTLLGRQVTWSSDNLPIATVSGDGVVHAVAAGTAKVQVTVDAVASNLISVTVQNVAVATVVVDPNPVSVKVGFTVQLTTTIRDSNGNQLLGRTVTWRSLDTSKATVASNGLVTGVATGGPIFIEATCEGVVGTAQLTVTP